MASNRCKNFIKNKFATIFPFYRIGYNLIALITLFFVLKFQDAINSELLFQRTETTQIIGYLISPTGLILAITAFKNYSGMEFIGLDFNNKVKSNKLNTSGFNKYIRHPLYFSSLLIIWGYFLSNPKATTLVMNSIITVYFIIGTKLEEQKLIKEFGEAYKQYIKRVPMLLPLKIFEAKKK